MNMANRPPRVPGLSGAAAVPELLGYVAAGAQPEWHLTFNVAEVTATWTLEPLDRWLGAALALRPPWPVAPDGAVTLALVARALALAMELMRAARIPVFDGGRIIAAEACEVAPQRRWRVRVGVPGIDHLPVALATGAHQAALRLVFAAVADLLRGVTPDVEQARQVAQVDVIGRLTPALPAGISTVPILREVWRRRIPFRHLGGGVFQLGWGAKSRRINRSCIDTDAALGCALASVKNHSATVLRTMGMPCPRHVLVGRVEEAHDAARQLGWPVVIKPADRERSEGVTTAIRDPAGVDTAFRHAARFSRAILVEQHIPGICHRLMVANGRFLYALARRPMALIGNGIDTIATLLERTRARAALQPPWCRDKVIPLDELTLRVLASQGVAPGSVPAPGQRVLLRFIESTEWGEDRVDVTAQTHPANAELAVRAARALGLMNAGVDIISQDISVAWQGNGAVINEVNFAPHFGGSESARTRMPAFIEGLIRDDGRIPVEVFVGTGRAWQAALRRQAAWRAEGLCAWVTAARDTVDEQGREQALACAGAFERTVALLSDRRVEALAIVLGDGGWVESGAPIDQIDAWHDCTDTPLQPCGMEALGRLLSALSRTRAAGV